MLIVIYNTYDKSGFIHGNRNRLPINTISYQVKAKILELYKTKYDGIDFIHFENLLFENEYIYISYNALYTLLRHHDIL